MTSLRAYWKTLRILLATFLGYAGLLVAKVIGLFAPEAGLRFRNASFRAWGRSLCRSFGMRWTVEGTPPSGRFFLVSNHVGYVDIPFLATEVDAAFVAKADLESWPLLGTIFAAADTIFIDRSRKRDVLRVMEQVRTALDRGLGAVLFPEGTSGKGDEILRFKPSLLEFAIQSGLPVHYATVCYRTRADDLPPSKGVCWWGDEPFFPHYRRLSRLGTIEAVLSFGEEPIVASDRKELAQKLHQAMVGQFEPMP